MILVLVQNQLLISISNLKLEKLQLNFLILRKLQQ